METLMTIADLAERMQITESVIRKHILKKVVPYIKIGAAIRFVPSEIEEWIKTGCKRGKPIADKTRPTIGCKGKQK